MVSFVVPVYSYTRVLFVLPSYILLLAFGLARIKNRSWTYALVALHLIFTGIYIATPRFHREDWRGLTAYIKAKAGAAVAMPSLEQSAPLVYYGLDLPMFEPQHNPPKPYETIYYINYAEDIFDPAQTGRKNLENSGFSITGEQTFPGLHLIVYESPFVPAVW